MDNLDIDSIGGLLFLIIVPSLSRYVLILLLEERASFYRFVLGMGVIGISFFLTLFAGVPLFRTFVPENYIMITFFYTLLVLVYFRFWRFFMPRSYPVKHVI